MTQHLTGKEFEELIIFRSRSDEELGRYAMGRYGVQGSFYKKPGDIKATWQPIQSYPDFEGVLMGGRQFIFEAKVCSSASFDLADVTKFAERQYSHMRKRALFGAVTFILLHFNARELKKKSEPAATYAIPISPKMLIWEQFERHELKTLTRTIAAEYGILVPWSTHSARSTKTTPEIYTAICAVLASLHTPVVPKHPTLEE